MNFKVYAFGVNFFFNVNLESLGSFDNGQLKSAVTEVEGMLTSLIDTVENSRACSTQPFSLPLDRELDLLQRSLLT